MTFMFESAVERFGRAQLVLGAALMRPDAIRRNKLVEHVRSVVETARILSERGDEGIRVPRPHRSYWEVHPDACRKLQRDILGAIDNGFGLEAGFRILGLFVGAHFGLALLDITDVIIRLDEVGEDEVLG